MVVWNERFVVLLYSIVLFALCSKFTNGEWISRQKIDYPNLVSLNARYSKTLGIWGADGCSCYEVSGPEYRTLWKEAPSAISCIPLDEISFYFITDSILAMNRGGELRVLLQSDGPVEDGLEGKLVRPLFMDVIPSTRKLYIADNCGIRVFTEEEGIRTIFGRPDDCVGDAEIISHDNTNVGPDTGVFQKIVGLTVTENSIIVADYSEELKEARLAIYDLETGVFRLFHRTFKALTSVSAVSDSEVFVVADGQLFLVDVNTNAVEVIAGESSSNLEIYHGSAKYLRFNELIIATTLSESNEIYGFSRGSLMLLSQIPGCPTVDPMNQDRNPIVNVTLTGHGSWISVHIEDDLSPFKSYYIELEQCCWSTIVPSLEEWHHYHDESTCKTNLYALLHTSRIAGCDPVIEQHGSFTRYKGTIRVRTSLVYPIKESNFETSTDIESNRNVPFEIDVPTSMVITSEYDELPVTYDLVIDAEWAAKYTFAGSSFDLEGYTARFTLYVVMPLVNNITISSISELDHNRTVYLEPYTISTTSTLKHAVLTVAIPLRNGIDCSYSGSYQLNFTIINLDTGVPEKNSRDSLTVKLTSEDICKVYNIRTEVFATLTLESNKTIFLIGESLDWALTLTSPTATVHTGVLYKFHYCMDSLTDIQCFESSESSGKLIFANTDLAILSENLVIQHQSASSMLLTTIITDSMMPPGTRTAKWRVMALIGAVYPQPVLRSLQQPVQSVQTRVRASSTKPQSYGVNSMYFTLQRRDSSEQSTGGASSSSYGSILLLVIIALSLCF